MLRPGFWQSADPPVPIAFDELFRQSPNAYMVLDRELRFLEANPAFEQLTGRTRAQLLGRGLFEVFPGTTNPDGSAQATRLRASLERTLASGERDELALIPYAIAPASPDSAPEVRYWCITHTPLRDADDGVFAVLQYVTDVTELQRLREQAQTRAAAVQRAYERLSARVDFINVLFAQAPGFMAVLRGPEHVFELANAAYERLVGRSDFIGQPVAAVLPEVAGQGFFELLDQVRASGQPYLGRGVAMVLDAGSGPCTHYVDFIYQPIRDAAGQVEGIFVQGADVTDREEALCALRDSEARLRAITNLLPQMIWSTRPDGYADYYNQRWYDYTGIAAGMADGDGWLALVHPEDRDRARERWHQSAATGATYEVEYRLCDRHGEYRWVLGRGVPVRDESGAITRWMGTCTDIHEHKLTLEALHRSRESLEAVNRQKDQFLAMLAHELRNPLAPISTAAHLLTMAPERVETVRQAAAIIDRQARHMRNLVEDLLDVSRVTRGLVAMQPSVMVLHEVLAAAVEQTAPLVKQRGHRLQVHDRAPGLRLWADPTRLTQVLANLLTNAAKYTPPGGRIDVDVQREGGGVLVRVRDTGIGMDAPLLGRLFELFAQAESTPERHEGGLGIGLALARSLVQLHGGTLDASSPGLGQGSTFELRLPSAAIVDEAPAPTAA